MFIRPFLYIIKLLLFIYSLNYLALNCVCSCLNCCLKYNTKKKFRDLHLIDMSNEVTWPWWQCSLFVGNRMSIYIINYKPFCIPVWHVWEKCAAMSVDCFLFCYYVIADTWNVSKTCTNPKSQWRTGLILGYSKE